ncbi:pyridoxamine 5'-phosphate oxidase family protein [Haloarchaeobius sp. HRN-SO-5]|uniref:pyridoxamine 5'-phosphate oxidase family protein n=1 Tax=Haloarchaeobius sp. HRN-SO-5 TaxID=3446118 RepID=UPI003EBF9C8F
MEEDSTVAMASGDRDTFLGNGGTGVISLATAGDTPPHTIPVSYGYDPVEETFYFRLAVGEQWSKEELDGRAVTFVTYSHSGHGNPGGRSPGGQPDNVDIEQDDEDRRWRSVVASGRLQNIEQEDIASESLAGLDRVDIPLVDMFGSPPGEITFEFLRLVPDELHAREETFTST